MGKEGWVQPLKLPATIVPRSAKARPWVFLALAAAIAFMVLEGSMEASSVLAFGFFLIAGSYLEATHTPDRIRLDSGRVRIDWLLKPQVNKPLSGFYLKVTDYKTNAGSSNYTYAVFLTSKEEWEKKLFSKGRFRKPKMSIPIETRILYPENLKQYLEALLPQLGTDMEIVFDPQAYADYSTGQYKAKIEKVGAGKRTG